MTILVIAEHDNLELNGSTLNTITAATELGSVTLLIAGSNCTKVANSAVNLSGVSKVLLVDDLKYVNALAEVLTPLILSLASDYTHILASATTFGKNLLPRVAAILDVQQISEITAIHDIQTFDRPVYAGNAIATVQSTDPVKVLTVRSTAFEAVNRGESAAEIMEVGSTENPNQSEFISTQLKNVKKIHQ